MSDRERSYETPSDEEMARLKRAQELLLDRLMSIPGVHTVGIGYKQRGGELTDELAVIVHVDSKRTREGVRPEHMVPPEIRFFLDSTDEEVVVSTDVIERPRFVEYWHLPDGALEGRVRPVPGGRSIHGAGVRPDGTLGGWVWDDVNDQPVLLSTYHILGDVPGAVYQPWLSQAPADHIADTVRTGTMDAAIAAPIDGKDALYEIEGIGPAVYETAVAVLNMPVEKVGARTEHTTGKVSQMNLVINGVVTNLFEVWPDQSAFADHGDSGALILEAAHPTGAGWKRVVGLLWGGQDGVGNAGALPIEDVFADLGLTTLCAGALADLIESIFERLFPVRPDFSVTPFRSRRPWLDRQRGLARELEAATTLTRRGRKLAKHIRRSRVGLTNLALDPTFRRALTIGVTPFFEERWTVSDIMGQPVTEHEVDRLRRVLRLAVEIRPDLTKLAKFANSLLEDLPGRSLADVLR